MRSLRIMAGLAVAVLALCATAASASAKEKHFFGEFIASVQGQELATNPAKLQEFKEDEPELDGLELANVKFGKWDRTTGEPNAEEPCAKVKLEGLVNFEKSPELQATLNFKKCYSNPEEPDGVVEENHVSSFKLAVRFKPNSSAEVGKSESQLQLEKTVVTVKDGLHKCPIIIPQQTIPFRDDLEREYEEVVAYSNEPPEELERWEHSKKLKELFPTDQKDRMEIELGERFRGIRTYVSQEPPCSNQKGTENPHLTEFEHKKVLEFKKGHIFADFEGVEVKNGQLEFSTTE